MFYRIEDRMAKDLKLSWNELLIYGVIYSSQNQTYVWGQTYLSEITWMSVATIKRSLKWMIENKLITKVSKWATYINTKITEDIKEEIKEEKIEEEIEEKKPVKKKYLDFVLLTEEEYNKLIDKYWKWIIERKIEDLNNYIWSKGKKYKSHYYTILERLRKENIKPLEKKISPAQTNNNDLHLDTRASWLKEAFPMNK